MSKAKQDIVDAFRPIKATSANASAGCSPTQQNPEVLGFIAHGSWVCFDQVDFGQGASYFQARVTTPMTGGSIEIYISSGRDQKRRLIGTCSVPTTGGWNNWTKVNCPIEMVEGIHCLTLVFQRRNKIDHLTIFDLHSFSFAASLAGLDREPSTQIFAADADSMSPNIKLEPSGDLEDTISTSAFRDGDGMAFARVNFSAETTWFEARVWVEQPGAYLEVHVIDMALGQDLLAGTLPLETFDLKPAWRTLGCEIQALSGRKIVELVYRNPQACYGFRLNWIRLSILNHRQASQYISLLDNPIIPASEWNCAHNVQVEPCNEGGSNIGYIRDGSFVWFDQLDFGDQDWHWVSARVASITPGALIDVLIDGKLQATLDVPRTGDWQAWLTVSRPLPQAIRGRHRVMFRFRGGESFLLNAQWFSFSPTASPVITPKVSLNNAPISLNHDQLAHHQSLGIGLDQGILLSTQDLVLIGKTSGLQLSIDSNDQGHCSITSQRGTLRLNDQNPEAVFRPTHGQADLHWQLPIAPRLLESIFWVPLAALSYSCGLLGRWSAQDATLELRTTAPGLPARGRLHISEGKLHCDRGNLLHGPSVVFDHDNIQPAFSHLDLIRSHHFNALHVYGENPDIHRSIGELTANIDDLVEFTASQGLHLILGAVSGTVPGSYNRDWLRQFWDHYAPRYANCTHVSYEIANQPFAWSAPYANDVIKMERELIDQIIRLAPDSHMLALSYSNLASPELVLRDLQALRLTEAERRHISVAWIGFDRSLDTIRSCLKVLRSQGWATINIEIPQKQRDPNLAINPITPDLELIKLCESLETGWLASLRVKYLAAPEVWRQPFTQVGINWQSD